MSESLILQVPNNVQRECIPIGAGMPALLQDVFTKSGTIAHLGFINDPRFGRREGTAFSLLKPIGRPFSSESFLRPPFRIENAINAVQRTHEKHTTTVLKVLPANVFAP